MFFRTRGEGWGDDEGGTTLMNKGERAAAVWDIGVVLRWWGLMAGYFGILVRWVGQVCLS